MGHVFSHSVQNFIIYVPAQTYNLIPYTLKIYIVSAVWPKLYILSVRKTKAADNGAQI